MSPSTNDRNNEPLHRDQSPPVKLPAPVWAKMSKDQRNAYLDFVRHWFQEMEDEERDKWRKANGY